MRPRRQQDWESLFPRSEQFDPPPSWHKPRRPATDMFPRSLPSRTAGPIIRQGTTYTHRLTSTPPCPGNEAHAPPSERKHAAAPVRLTPLKRAPFPSPTGHVAVPATEAVNSAPNEASNPYPAASGHGSVPPTTSPPAHPCMAPPIAPTTAFGSGLRNQTGAIPTCSPAAPYSRSG